MSKVLTQGLEGQGRRQGYSIQGIDTGVGKTFISAIFMQALQGCYWKPLQAGRELLADGSSITDTEQVLCYLDGLMKGMKGRGEGQLLRTYPEWHLLQAPLGAYFAAKAEGLELLLEDFRAYWEVLLRSTKQPLVVEGAGGLLNPLSKSATCLDLCQVMQLPVVLVATHYLGSLNHTLLSVACLKQAGLPIAGLVSDQSLEEVIRRSADLNTAAHALGCDLAAPFMTLSFLSLSPIPALKLTDQGLVDAVQMKLTSLFED